MDYDNPAARLLAILDEGMKQQAAQSCRAVWNALLRTEGSQSLLMSRLGKVYELPGLVNSAIDENFPAHRKHTQHWEAKVNHALMNQNLAGQWSTFIGHIDSHTISYLSLTAELLHSKATTKAIADEQILEVRDKIEAVYKDVLSGAVPQEIKTYLAHYLRAILGSIDEYFLTGAMPLLETTSALLGHAFVDEKYRSFLRNEALGLRVFECLTAMANVVTVSVGLPQLSQALGLLALQ